MIPVELVNEPADFHETVRVPGQLAVAEMTGQRPASPRRKGRPCKQRMRRTWQADGRQVEVPITDPKDLQAHDFPPYWRGALPNLLTAYENICAYSCFYIHPITGGASVDHMAPKSKVWHRVYEWDNYRLACARLNARKSDFSDVLDPFEIGTNWFELELVGFQVRPGAKLSSSVRDSVESTIDRLGLNDFDFRSQRESDAEDYWAGYVALSQLEMRSPFVARELGRQGRLSQRGA